MLHKRNLDFEGEIAKIEPSFRKLLFRQHISNEEYIDLFWTIHSACLWVRNGPMTLLDKLKKMIVDRVEFSLTNLIKIEDDQALLKIHTEEWNEFYGQFRYIEDVLKMLVSTLAEPNNDCVRVNFRNILIDEWQRIVEENIVNRLLRSARKLIESERNCQSFNPALIIGLRDCFVAIAYCSDENNSLNSAAYQQRFEEEYVTFTKKFYHTAANQYLQENGIIKYVQYVHEKIKEEEERGCRYLGSNSYALSNTLKCCDKVLVEPYVQAILAECPNLFQQNDTGNLFLIFRYIGRVSDRVTPMIAALERHIVDFGLADMKDEAVNIVADSDKYVHKLLDLFKRFDTLVQEVFDNDTRFVTARDRAFKTVINDTSVFKLELQTKVKIQPESRCPELLANYCDLLLRKTSLSKKMTPDDVECVLKDVIFVLKYVQSKDVFMQYYISHLTRRLILQTSMDNDKEENMVRWLRGIGMPADFLNRITMMLQDIKLSDDAYKSLKQTRNTSVDVNTKILNSGAWKLSDKMEITIPVELEKFVYDQDELYKVIHTGRKLQWNHSMSNATISFHTNVGKYDLEVTNLQLTVLFAWNQHSDSEISFECLRMTTLLSEYDLRKTVWSLVAFPHMKEQVLLSRPEAKSPNDIKDDTKFIINRQFAVCRNNKPQKRGKINLIGRLQLSMEKTNCEDNEAIVALRVFRTQEAIVKVMKSKKTVTVAQLQMNVVDILKDIFVPSAAVIKQQIEWLIDNDFIRRDVKNMNTLNYVA